MVTLSLSSSIGMGNISHYSYRDRLLVYKGASIELFFFREQRKLEYNLTTDHRHRGIWAIDRRTKPRGSR
jgi:hypothetical protein